MRPSFAMHECIREAIYNEVDYCLITGYLVSFVNGVSVTIFLYNV